MERRHWTVGVLLLVLLPTGVDAQDGAECATVECARATAPDQSQSARRLWVIASGVRDRKQAFGEAIRALAVAQAGGLGNDAPEIERAAARDALASWDAAIRRLESETASHLRAAETHMVLGTVYLDRQRHAEAVREFSEAVRIEPERPDAYAWLSLAQAAERKPDDSLRSLQRAVDLGPSDAALTYRLAHVLRTSGRVEESRRALQRFARLRSSVAPPALGTRPSPQSPFAVVPLMRRAAGAAPAFPSAAQADTFALMESGDFARAVATRDPGTAVELPNQQALALWVMGDHNGALRELRNALGQRPDDERTRLVLAFVLREAGRPSEAEQELRAAAAAFPRAGLPWYRLGQLLESQARLPEAAQAFAESLARPPVLGLDGLNQRVARIRVNQADFDGAVTAYVTRISLNPNNAEAHRSLGEIYYLQGRDEEALAEFLVAVWLDPMDARAFAALGKVQVRAQRYADAVPVLQRAVMLDQGRVDAHYALGQALVRIGRPDDARREIAEYQQLDAAEREKGQRDFRLEQSRVEAGRLLAAGDTAGAIAVLQSLTGEDPQNPRWQRELGAAFLRVRRFADAVNVLEAAQSTRATVEGARLLADAYAAAGRIDESRQLQGRYDEAIRDARLAQLRDLENGP